MSTSDFTLGQAKSALKALEAILKKGEASPNGASLPDARIVDDMLPLSFQVHVVTDTASKLVARLTGADPTPFENNLKTFADFYERIEKVNGILAGADAAAVEAGATRTVTFGMGPGKNVETLGKNFVLGYCLPNIFFHTATAYNIIRKNGVDVGKMDYLTPFVGPYMS